ncbi:MAG: hypothetical protein OK457_08295 [Thaumarchaeota archaeon]|nr:hypothetical protein [Nitrososphaerota archaeon]
MSVLSQFHRRIAQESIDPKTGSAFTLTKPQPKFSPERIGSKSVKKDAGVRPSSKPPVPPPSRAGRNGPNNNRRLLIPIVSICVVLLVVGVGFVYFSPFTPQNSTLSPLATSNLVTGSSTCTTGSAFFSVAGPNGSTYLTIKGLVRSFDAKYCTKILLIPLTSNTPGIQGVISGALDVAFVMNYTTFQQAAASQGNSIHLEAFQVGSTGSGSTFWLVTNGTPEGTIHNFITFVESNFAG